MGSRLRGLLTSGNIYPQNGLHGSIVGKAWPCVVRGPYSSGKPWNLTRPCGLGCRLGPKRRQWVDSKKQGGQACPASNPRKNVLGAESQTKNRQSITPPAPYKSVPCRNKISLPIGPQGAIHIIPNAMARAAGAGHTNECFPERCPVQTESHGPNCSQSDKSVPPYNNTCNSTNIGKRQTRPRSRTKNSGLATMLSS